VQKLDTKYFKMQPFGYMRHFLLSKQTNNYVHSIHFDNKPLHSIPGYCVLVFLHTKISNAVDLQPFKYKRHSIRYILTINFCILYMYV
jgi:hypothetical protein